jgi:tRNA (guanine37-N1)-methyltransferase
VKTDISKVILLSPSGTTFKQAFAERLVSKNQHLILICGHYEGVDERVIELLVDEQISIGDYILTNGALASAVISDAIVRLIPGVLGGGESARQDESYSKGLLDFPQYTRPVEFRNLKVPDILLSGDHALISEWRYKQALERTAKFRPDLLKHKKQKD